MSNAHSLLILASWTCFMPLHATACSETACINQGIEMRHHFTVAIRHEGKPLPGVSVAITDVTRTSRFLAVSNSLGIVDVPQLPTGEYWLEAKLLGIHAAYRCFHVADRPSYAAKRKMRYDWGDLAPATQQLAGNVIYSRPGTGESPILNLIHRSNVPIIGAKLSVTDPITQEVYRSVADATGHFEFKSVPPGLYVLHVEQGETATEFEPADILIRLSWQAKSVGFALIGRPPGAGSCGGTSLELQVAQSPRSH